MSPISLSGTPFQVQTPQFRAVQPPRFGMATTQKVEASIAVAKAYRETMGNADAFEDKLSAIRGMRGNTDAIDSFTERLERKVAENRVHPDELDFAEAVLAKLSPAHAIARDLKNLFREAVVYAQDSGADSEIGPFIRKIQRLEHRDDYQKGLPIFLDWLLGQSLMEGEQDTLKTEVLRKMSPEHFLANQILKIFERSMQGSEPNVFLFAENIEELRRLPEHLVNGAALAAICLSHRSDPKQAAFFRDVFPILMEVIADNKLSTCRQDLSDKIENIYSEFQIGSRFNTFG